MQTSCSVRTATDKNLPARPAYSGTSGGTGNVRSGAKPSSQAGRPIDKTGRDHGVEDKKSSLVFIIDDDHWSREGVNCYLEACGYDCAMFCSAEEYLAANAVWKSACLIVDVQLPGMKGPELQDRLMAGGYRIPIIFITGYCDGRVRDRVLRTGAIAYLTKPWCERTLSGCLERVLGVGAR